MSDSGSRLSTGRVSGSRTAIQTRKTSDSAKRLAKIRCQLPASRKPLPIVGASTGTMMKTIMTKDITSAIRRPP